MSRKIHRMSWKNRRTAAAEKQMLLATQPAWAQCVAEALEGRLLLSHATYPNPPGTPWAIPASGSATIEAENYDQGGEGVAYHDLTTANQGGAYRTVEGVDIEAVSGAPSTYAVDYTQAGEWMEYSVNVASNTTYTINFRVASGAKPGGMFHLNVDGVNVTGAMSVPQTSAWNVYSTISKAGLALTAGQHVLRLVMDSVSSTNYVGNFNWIQLVAGSSRAPYGGTPAPIPGTIEAENYDTGGEGVTYHDLTSLNQGMAYRTSEAVDIEAISGAAGQYAVDYTQAGEWMEYTTSVASTGTYTIAFSVASAGKPGGTFHLNVDGVNVTGTMSIPQTSAWNVYTTVAKTGVSLTAGQHVLRLVMDTVGGGGYVGNFDRMQFTAAAPSLISMNAQPVDVGTAVIGWKSDISALEFSNNASVPVTISNVHAPAGFMVFLSTIDGYQNLTTLTLAAPPVPVGSMDASGMFYVQADTSTGGGGPRSGVVTFTASNGTQTETDSFTVQANVIGDTPDVPALAALGTPASPTVFQYTLPADGYIDPISLPQYVYFGARLYEFHVVTPSTLYMHLSATASQAAWDPVDYPTTLSANVYADTNGNNKLDASDLSSNPSKVVLNGVDLGVTSTGDATPVTLRPGNYFLRLTADVSDYNNNSFPYTLTVSAAPARSPYGGTSAPIPGTIEAENFDTGGEGVAYHDLTAANQAGAYRTSDGVDIEAISGAAGAYAVDYTQAGEWMEYTTNVASSGTYTVNFRVASGGKPGGTFHLNVDGVNVTGPMSVPQTSAWNVYSTVSKAGISLTAGQHVLRLVMDSTGATGYVGNFNWMQFVAPAAPGTLDTSFGTGGKVTQDFGGADSANQTIVQMDGKILVAGRSGSNFVLARFNTNGTLDTGFGVAGKITIAPPALYSPMQGSRPMVVLPDGKILVALSYSKGAAGPWRNILARYTQYGVADTTFGTGGGMVTYDNFFTGGINDLEVQLDGKIVAACTANASANAEDVSVVRFNSNGSIDTAFGAGGQTIYDFGGFDAGPLVAIDNNGRIVLTCNADGLYEMGLGVMRLNSNGTMDATFSSGRMLFPEASQNNSFNALAVDSANRIVLAGYSDYAASMIVCRLTASGTWDTSFGGRGDALGIFYNGLMDYSCGTAIALSNDSILVGGSCLPAQGGYAAAVARFSSTGQLDPTFGTGGKAVTDLGADDDATGDIALQPDGGIILAGESAGNIVLARYVGTQPVASPFQSTAAIAPGIVQCENFDAGGEGISYHDLTAYNEGGTYRYSGVDIEAIAGGDYAVDYTKAGEWLQYTFSCSAARSYNFFANVASGSAGGKFHLEIDGVSLGSVAVLNTGGWGTYASVAAGSKALTAGTHTLRLVMDAGGASGYVGNFNSINVV